MPGPVPVDRSAPGNYGIVISVFISMLSYAELKDIYRRHIHIFNHFLIDGVFAFKYVLNVRVVLILYSTL